MSDLTIYPSSLSGKIKIPPSKSHTQRALLFSMLGEGKSRLHNPLISPDTASMMQAISQFGVKVEKQNDYLDIHGGFTPPEEIIDAGNSGQVLRFIGAMAARLPCYTTITGDASIRKIRPIKPLLKALRQLGALAESIEGDGFAPIMIRGPIHPGTCHLVGDDSQPVSALLIATSFLEGSSEIFVDSPGETPWIDVTLRWLTSLGASISCENYTHYKVKGGLLYSGFNYTVPGDFSTAAFPIVAALITHSSLTIEGLDPQDVQGDKQLIPLLQEMGAKISWKENVLCVEPSQALQGREIDVNPYIDALPILAVLGCFAEGTTTLVNGSIARQKESDRIRTICQELEKMGADIEEKDDGLVVRKSTLHGANLESHRDHRIALSLAVAALGAQGFSTLFKGECLEKTYPSFVEDFQNIGAKIELDLVRV